MTPATRHCILTQRLITLQVQESSLLTTTRRLILNTSSPLHKILSKGSNRDDLAFIPDTTEPILLSHHIVRSSGVRVHVLFCSVETESLHCVTSAFKCHIFNQLPRLQGKKPLSFAVVFFTQLKVTLQNRFTVLFNFNVPHLKSSLHILLKVTV